MYFIDTHTHFGMLEHEVEAIISEAEKQNILQFVNIGTGHDDHQQVLSTAQAFYPKIFCTLGVHPHDAKEFELAKNFMLQNLQHKEVIAVGEIGLDYYYMNSDAETQKRVFRQQMQIAVDHGLPVEIHTRDAEDDTIAILNEFKGKVTGLIHCFTGTQSLANAALECGLNISISGVVTFKTARELRDVVATIPLDRLHVETDAPFLAPMPHRGKKNQPAFMIETAKKVAELKGVGLEQLASQILQNTNALFPRWVSIHK